MDEDADGTSFDVQAVLERGLPRRPGVSGLAIKNIANNTHDQVFSKKTALGVIGKLAFAHDTAEFIVAKILTEAKVENPELMQTQEMLSYLSPYIGELSFRPEYISEVRHIADKAGVALRGVCEPAFALQTGSP